MSDDRVRKRHPFLMIFQAFIASAALALGAWLGVTRPRPDA
jgi:hypothetical protein